MDLLSVDLVKCGIPAQMVVKHQDLKAIVNSLGDRYNTSTSVGQLL